MLSASPDRVTGAAADALRSLVSTIPPRDAAQVLRLARVLRRVGDRETAAPLLLVRPPGQRRQLRDEEELDVVTVRQFELVSRPRTLRGRGPDRADREHPRAAIPATAPGSASSCCACARYPQILPPVEALERARGRDGFDRSDPGSAAGHGAAGGRSSRQRASSTTSAGGRDRSRASIQPRSPSRRSAGTMRTTRPARWPSTTCGDSPARRARCPTRPPGSSAADALIAWVEDAEEKGAPWPRRSAPAEAGRTAAAAGIAQRLARFEDLDRPTNSGSSTRLRGQPHGRGACP